MVRPKKSLGQNFLVDKNIIKKILSLVNINENNIIEIGPGTGNLTNEILKKNPSNFLLIEKDRNLYKQLKERNKNNNVFSIFNEDILNFDLEKRIKKNSIVFGNLPYNISTQILIKMIKFKSWPPNYKKLIFMFQKEVADRILAKSNTKKYGRLKIITSWRLKVSKSFHISKNCFYPTPKVDSTILVFEPIKNKNFVIKNLDNLEKITEILFSGKRKMINKAFAKLFKNSKYVSNKLKINLSSRPSELSEESFYKITEFFENYKKASN